MNSRIAAIMALALVAALAIVPLTAYDTDAATAEDIQLTLPDTTSEVVEVTVGNGSETDFTLYVYNKSDTSLRVTATTTSSSEHVSIEAEPAQQVLDSGKYMPVTVTVTADRYEAADAETGEITLTFDDITAAGTFTMTVSVAIDVDSTYYSEGGNNKFLGVFDNTLDDFLGSEWFTAIVTLVAWILISFVASLIFVPLFIRLFTRDYDDKERRKTKRSLTSMIVALIAVIAINQCLAILGVSPEIRDSYSILASILYIVIGAMIGWTVYVFAVTAIVRRMGRGEDATIDESLIPLFKMIGKIIIAVVAVGSILAIFGVDLNGILVSAGVITLGITMGAQNILSQFFSGIVLLSTRPFKKGDFVKIGGEVYIVRKVKLMFTEFDNWDADQVVTIPNNVVSGGTIVNMTAEDEEARAYVYVKVVYGTDLDKATELMKQAAMEHPHVIKDGSRSMPSTRLTDVAGNAMELRLAAYTDSFDNCGGYAGEMRRRIYQLFDENGIQLPPNAIDVIMKEPCDGKRRAHDTATE